MGKKSSSTKKSIKTEKPSKSAEKKLVKPQPIAKDVEIVKIEDPVLPEPTGSVEIGFNDI